MDDRQDKAQVIKENIESTINNAIKTQNEIVHTTDIKKQRELLEKNERRVQAIPSMVKNMKEEEAKRELESLE